MPNSFCHLLRYVNHDPVTILRRKYVLMLFEKIKFLRKCLNFQFLSHICYSLNMPAQLYSGVRSLNALILYLRPNTLCVSSEGSDESAQMRSLVLVFTAHTCDKHQNLIN